MLEIAVIKTTPSSSEAPAQNARKSVGRDTRDDYAQTFQNEYETSADKPEKDKKTDSSDAETRADRSEKSETPASASENPDAEADLSSGPDGPGSETAEAVAGFDDKTSEESTADKPPRGIGEDQVMRAPSGPDRPVMEENPGAEAAPVESETGQAHSKADAIGSELKPVRSQGRSTAESIIMSKALEGQTAVQADARAERPATAERAGTPSAAVATVATGAQERMLQTSPAGGLEQPASIRDGRAEELRLRKAEQRFADLPTGASPVKTVDLAMKAAPPVLQPIAKIETAREKVDTLSISALDAEVFGTSEPRASSTGATQSLAQILSRPETPSMIARQMAEVLQRLPDRPVEISLNPKELGRVRMSISAVEAGITVSVMAERPETLDLMRRNIDQLAREFQSIGYEDINFAFSEGEAKQQFADEQPDGSAPQETVTRIDLTPVDTAANSGPERVRSNGIDIRL